MITRNIADLILTEAKYFPIVTVMGPRQSGKTTLVKSLFPNHQYVNLERLELRELARNDPNAFFKRFPQPVILDEIQQVPELLSQIQALSDENPVKGGFVLTGSQQVKLKIGVAQSLAGRTSVARLLPLSIAELRRGGFSTERDELIYRGFLPRGYADDIPPSILYESYLSTYVERDVLQWVNAASRRPFNLFVRMLAARVGNILNCSALASDVGVSSQTVANWISILEESYIIHLLPAFSRNSSRRLVKAPKVYFTDTGLAAHLAMIESREQLATHQQLGGLFENMVVMDKIKERLNQGKSLNLAYYRDKNGLEIDIVETNPDGTLHPIEIKAAMTYNRALTRNLVRFCAVYPEAKSPTLIYSGDTLGEVAGITVTHFAVDANSGDMGLGNDC